MDWDTVVFLVYALFGLILIAYNDKIADLNHRLVLFYNHKLKLKDFFIFKVDEKNRSRLFLLSKAVCIIFGLLIFATAVFNIIN